MKIGLILIIIFLFISSCINKLHNSTWKIYNTTMDIEDDLLKNTNAFDYMVNMKTNGAKIIIEKDSIKFKGNGFDFGGKLLSITNKKILVLGNNQEYQIQYFLSNNKRECEFIFANGSRSKAKREK